MKNFLILLLVHLFINAKAQLISTRPMQVYTGTTTFDTSIVRLNKIKSITTIIVDKPDGSVIVDKGATQHFEFDNQGKVTSHFYTVLNKIIKEEITIPPVRKRGRIIRPASSRTLYRYTNDTVFTKLYYDSLQQLIAKRFEDGDYFDAWYYEYDSTGKVRKEIHCKETNVSENKSEYKLGIQRIISLETFKYDSLTATQIRKICMNDEGREYKKTIINFDSRGNKISELYKFTVGWMRQETAYEYDNKNRLIKMITSSNIAGDLKEERTYEYNEKNLLLAEKLFKDNKLLNEISYLFDEKGLIKSHVSRDFKNASIGIVKYVYTYY